MGQVWLDIVIVFVLLIIGGLFTSTELALVSLRAGQLQAIGARGKRGARVVKLAGEPTRYLAAVQIGSIVAGSLRPRSGPRHLPIRWLLRWNPGVWRITPP